MDEIKKDTNDVDFDKIIQDFLPLENGSAFMEGSEGKAYFVGDDYVIKKFPDRSKIDIEGLYCYYDEMLKLHEMGINLPEFYSYFVSSKNDFYILQERIKGVPLRIDYLESNYPMFMDLCSSQEYHDLLNAPMKHKSLFHKIVIRFASKFLEVSQMLEGVSESELEKFIVDVFTMYNICKFGEPDLHSTNVFLTDKGIYNIDNFVTRDWGFDEKVKVSEKDRKINAFLQLYRMLEENDIINELSGEYRIYLWDQKLDAELNKIISKNNAVCKNTALRIAKVVKKILDDPNVIDKDVLKNLYSNLKEIFPSDTKDMVEDISQIFQQ